MHGGDELSPCIACVGRIGRACETCRGAGWIKKRREPIRPPGEQMSELLSAWAGIERDGMDGWLARQRAAGRMEELDEHGLMLMDVLRAKLDELEFEQDIDDAIRDAKSRK